MSYETIQVETQQAGQVEWISLGPPPANIVSARLIGELSEALIAATARAETKAIVIAGTGKHFSYGASVEEHAPERISDVLPRLHGLIGALLECPVPTIAAVSGLCLGGGFEVAMSCSMIVCDARAKFGVPEIKLGVFPPVASVLLPRLVGEASAAKIIFSGETVDAEFMRNHGAVNEILAEGVFAEEVSRFVAANLLDKSAASLRLASQALRAPLAEHYRSRISSVEQLYLGELMSTEDAVEGIQAFLDKRSPEWKNR